MHLNWKFCIIPCTGHFMWLFHFQLGCIHLCTYILNCREINIYMYKNIIIIHLILHVFFLRSKNTNVCTKMYVHKCMQPSWKWNNHIKCPVQDIIQNFQFKCIFLEHVDVTIQFPPIPYPKDVFAIFAISTVEVPMSLLPTFLPYFAFGFNWYHMFFFIWP
jgi:hypothetical protein